MYKVAMQTAVIKMNPLTNQLSSTAAKKSKKGEGMKKLFRGIFKRPRPANDSASQSNSTRVSQAVPSASGAHDPVAGNVARSAEPMASGKCIGSILVLSTTIWSLQMTKLFRIRVRTVLNSYLSDLLVLGHHPDPTTPFQSTRFSSSVPDMLDSAVGQGELQYAQSLRLKY